MRGTVCLLLMLASVAAASPAQGQSKYDGVAISTGPQESARAATQPAVNQNIPSMEGPSLWRLGLSVAAVIGLILLARPALKKFNGTARSSKDGAVRVLSRTTIGPRQQVLLLAVGRTVMVVADSGGRLSTLGTIADADEAARLMGSASQAVSRESLDDDETPSKFAGMFRRERAAYEPPTPPAELDEEESINGEMDAAQQELAAMLRRVKSMQDEVKIRS